MSPTSLNACNNRKEEKDEDPTVAKPDWFQLPDVKPEFDASVVDHLIIVAGHAVLGGGQANQWKEERSWILEPHQKGSNGLFIKTLGHHIELGIDELTNNFDRSILVFSGGQTRDVPLSEAVSCYLVAKNEDFFQKSKTEAGAVGMRIFAEEFARDGYENVLFSIARFREVTGGYPSYITVVGFEYKRHRFEKAHRTAVVFPKSQFNYRGYDMTDAAKAEGIELGANFKLPSDEFSFLAANADPYLCKKNKATRQQRNSQRRVPPYFSSCPEIHWLMRYCGPQIFSGALPWRDVKPKKELP